MKIKLSRELRIGIFGIIMMGAIYLSVNYLKNNNIFSSNQIFYSVFDTANGLMASAPVKTKGFKIGTIEDVRFNAKTQNITVKYSINKIYPIPIDSKVKITTDGLMGGQIIEIEFGENEQTYHDRDTINAVFELGMLQIFEQEYSSIKDKLQNYLVQIDSMFVGINAVLSKNNIENISQAIHNINTTTAILSEISTSQQNSIKSIMSNVDSISSSLNDIMPSAKRTINNLALASDSFPILINDASLSLKKLTHIISKVESGDGNIAKLLNDTLLYNDINRTVESLNLLLDDVKTNPGRYINIKVFGKTYEEKKLIKADKEAAKAAKNNKKRD